MTHHLTAMSWKLSAVLALLLLVPRAVLAEELALEAAPPARTELPPSLHLLEPTPESESTTLQLARVLTMTGGAILTGTAPGGAGALLGLTTCGYGVGDCISAAVVGIAVGGVLGAPLGAVWSGALLDGRGSYMGALGGALLGGAAGIAATIAFTGHSDVGTAYSFPVLTVLGAVIGYEISHSMTPPSPAAPGLQPMLSISPRGTTLGMGGRF